MAKLLIKIYLINTLLMSSIFGLIMDFLGKQVIYNIAQILWINIPWGLWFIPIFIFVFFLYKNLYIGIKFDKIIDSMP